MFEFFVNFIFYIWLLGVLVSYIPAVVMPTLKRERGMLDKIFALSVGLILCACWPFFAYAAYTKARKV